MPEKNIGSTNFPHIYKQVQMYIGNKNNEWFLTPPSTYHNYNDKLILQISIMAFFPSKQAKTFQNNKIKHEKLFSI